MNPTGTPPTKLVAVFIALMALLAASYAVAHADLGRLDVPLVLLIAAIKAGLVALYFMELRHADCLNRLAAGLGVFWLGILISLSLTDYLSRGWLWLPGHWP